MSNIPATQQAQLPLSSKLSTQAKKAAVLNDLHSSSLISFGQLCGDNCEVILDKRYFYVIKYEDLILQEKRNLTGGLWYIALPVPNIYIVPKPSKNQYFTVFQPIPEHSLSVIIRKIDTKTDLASYLHAACFSPVHSVFIKYIRNNQFTTCPVLTSKFVTKHLSTSIANTKGHINQKHQKLQSTKSSSPIIQIKDKYNDDDLFPLSDTANV